MKQKMFLNLAMLSGVALMALAPAFAQDREMVDAKIPFAFNVGSKMLPAGNYEVSNTFTNTLVIRNTATHQAVMAITNADSPKQIEGDGAVIFRSYGDTYFLSAVQAGENRKALGVSKTEREAAAKAAETANNTPSGEVYVAAFTH